MNGAHALIETLVNAGVDTCFANPGTSEMHFVAAVDDIPQMRSILCLFEGVATGAADGYARVADRPATTLLHLGPGLANGIANLHNARRARSPIVNIVGDHATYHKKFDSPLESDIDSVAGTVSGWVERPMSPAEVGNAAARAVAASFGPPPQIATLILPADVSWDEGASPGRPIVPSNRGAVDPATVAAVARLLRSDERCVVLLGGQALRADALRFAGRIRSATPATVLTTSSTPRIERGPTIPSFERIQYRAEAAVAQLAGARHLILVAAKSPVSFFAYPGQESSLIPADCQVHVLGSAGDDVVEALGALADLVDRGGSVPAFVPATPLARPVGSLTAVTAAVAIGCLLPEGAIVVDESITVGAALELATAGAPPHDWLRQTGGSIGMGLPVAVGAAVAAPNRKVLALQADGSAMYTIQALWTMAREQLDVTTVIFNNRSYAILNVELKRVGATAGPKALDMLDLSRPTLDFVALAQGMGVPAERATTAEEFIAALNRALATTGPSLIDAVLE
jgi:acetolactate synthase-1/2/3 large subunit